MELSLFSLITLLHIPVLFCNFYANVEGRILKFNTQPHKLPEALAQIRLQKIQKRRLEGLESHGNALKGAMIGQMPVDNYEWIFRSNISVGTPRNFYLFNVKQTSCIQNFESIAI